MSTRRAFLVVVVVSFALFGLLLTFLRTPGDRWDRARAALDDVPVDELELSLGEPVENEYGTRWRLLFGSDSTVSREYEVFPDLDIELSCERMRQVAEGFVDGEFIYRAPMDDDPLPFCQVTYRVDQPTTTSR